MKTFDYGGGVNEISSAQDAHEVRVELRDLYPGRSMHGERKGTTTILHGNNKKKVKTQARRSAERSCGFHGPFGKKKGKGLLFV